MDKKPSAADEVQAWRRLGAYLLLFGMAGMGAELVLLGHFEDRLQWTPLVLLGLGALVGAAVLLRPTAGTVRALRALMVAYLLAGVLGVFLHLRSNVEFEKEMRPSIAGRELFLETLTGAIPALAPGAMAQLGLLGLLICFRHPLTYRVHDESE